MPITLHRIPRHYCAHYIRFMTRVHMQSFSMARAVTYASVVCVVAAPMLACSIDQGGFSEPENSATSGTDLSITVTNPLDYPVFVELTKTSPAMNVSQSGTALIVDPGCTPLCGTECNCEPCAVAPLRYQQLDAGQQLTFTWAAMHFINSQCADEHDCYCAESWPLTAGKYTLSFQAVTELQGQQLEPGTSNIWVGATPSVDSARCTASTSWVLSTNASNAVETHFQCPD